VVIVLIIALDRPETGIARLNQKPLLTLQKQLHGMQFPGISETMKDSVNNTMKH